MCRFTFWTYEDVVLDAYVRESESGFRLAVRALLVALHTSQLIQQLLSTALTHISLYIYLSSLSSLSSLVFICVDMCGYEKSC